MPSPPVPPPMPPTKEGGRRRGGASPTGLGGLHGTAPTPLTKGAILNL